MSLFHIKCNFKDAIDGGYWQWHQDYANWKANDASPRPRPDYQANRKAESLKVSEPRRLTEAAPAFA